MAEQASEPTNVIDLMDVLRRSVANARKAGSRRGQDLSALNKEQLLALARDLGIPGRSAMNRRQLETAINSAGKPARQAA